MSTDAIHAESAAQVPAPQPLASAPPRVWPAFVILALYWAFRFAADQFDMSTLMVFITRMAAHALLFISFLIWWFSRRRVRLADRLLAVVVVAVGGLAIAPLCDPTMSGPALAMLALPCIFTVWAAWTFVAGRSTLAVQRAGFCLLVLSTWGFFTLLRWDGIDGRQHSELQWRWQPSAEQLFLAEQAKTRPSETPPDEAAPLAPRPGDWTEFRGPNRDGIVFDCRINEDWKAKAPRLVWRQRIGPGWSTFSIVGDRLFTQEQRGDQEAVVCYDAATGAEIWVHEDAVRFYEGLSGAGPRSTPTFTDGKIYALGARGNLSCLDAANGKPLWSRDIAKDAEAQVPQWGFSSSPLATDGLVLVYAGGKGKGLLAYDSQTGKLAWSAPCGTNSYSSPQKANLAGVPQVLMAADQELKSFDPASGKLLWQTSVGDEVLMPEIQPHVLSDSQLLVQSGAGLKLLDVSRQDGKWKFEQRWKSNALRPSFNEYIVLDDHAFGYDEGIFGCLDLKTGKRTWKRGRYGHGQAVLLAEQQLLLVLTETGEVVLLAADPKQLKELGRFQAIEGKCWNYPLVAGSRLYVRNGEEAACYDLGEPQTP